MRTNELSLINCILHHFLTLDFIIYFMQITEDQVIVSNILSILNVLANYKYVGKRIFTI